MSPLSVALLVVGILAGTAAALFLVWIPVSARMRKLVATLGPELAAEGEPAVRGPETGGFQGASGQYGRVKGAGVIAMTDKRLVFRGVFGKRIDLDLTELTAVREDKWFLRSYKGGRPYLIIKTKAGVELGFFVKDHAGWMVALRNIISTQPVTLLPADARSR